MEGREEGSGGGAREIGRAERWMDSARVMAVASAMRGAAAGMRIDIDSGVGCCGGMQGEEGKDRARNLSRRRGGNLSLVIGQRGTPDPIVFFSRCSVVLMCLPRLSLQQHIVQANGVIDIWV